MRYSTAKRIPIFTLLLALTSGWAALGQTGDIKVGEPFPQIVLPALDGAPTSIRNFAGKKLILHVWASW